MKKILRLVTTSVLTLTLVACGEASSSVSSSVNTGNSSVPNVSSAYANVTSVTLSAASNLLTQVMGTQKRVTVTASLNANTNPNLTLEWYVNGVKQAQIGRIFDFTPTEAGSFAITARLGNVVSNTLTVTAGLPSLNISEAKFLNQSTIELSANAGANVTVVGATMLSNSYFDLTSGKYIINLQDPVEQGESVTVRLERPGFSTETRPVVYDTRTLTIVDVKLDVPELTTDVELNANGGVYKITKPFDAGAQYQKTIKVNLAQRNIITSATPQTLTVQTAVPAGATAVATQTSLVTILQTIDFIVNSLTAPGLYVQTISLGGKAVEVKFEVLAATPELIIPESFSTSNFKDLEVTGLELPYGVSYGGAPAHMLSESVYEVVKPFATLAVPTATSNTDQKLEFNFILRNFAEQELLNNQYSVNLVGPSALLGSTSQLFDGIEVKNTTVQAANRTNIYTNNSFVTFNGSSSTTGGATKTSVLGNVVQWIDATTPAGDYVFTVSAGQSGQGFTKDITIRVSNPAPKIDFILDYYAQAGAPQNGGGTATLRNHVVTQNGDNFTIEKPVAGGSAINLEWFFVLSNWQSALETDATKLANDQIELNYSNRATFAKDSDIKVNGVTITNGSVQSFNQLVEIGKVNTGLSVIYDVGSDLTDLFASAPTGTFHLEVAVKTAATGMTIGTATRVGPVSGFTAGTTLINLPSITVEESVKSGTKLVLEVKAYATSSATTAEADASAEINLFAYHPNVLQMGAQLIPTTGDNNYVNTTDAFNFVDISMDTSGPSNIIPEIPEFKVAMLLASNKNAVVLVDQSTITINDARLNKALDLDNVNDKQLALDTTRVAALYPSATKDLFDRAALSVSTTTVAGTYTMTLNVDGLSKRVSITIQEPKAKVFVLSSFVDVEGTASNNEILLKPISITDVQADSEQANFFATSGAGMNQLKFFDNDGHISETVFAAADHVYHADDEFAQLVNGKYTIELPSTLEATKSGIFGQIAVADLPLGTYNFGIKKFFPNGAVEEYSDTVTVGSLTGHNLATLTSTSSNFEPNWILNEEGLEVGEYRFEFSIGSTVLNILVDVIAAPRMEITNLLIGSDVGVLFNNDNVLFTLASGSVDANLARRILMNFDLSEVLSDDDYFEVSVAEVDAGAGITRVNSPTLPTGKVLIDGLRTLNLGLIHGALNTTGNGLTVTLTFFEKIEWAEYLARGLDPTATPATARFIQKGTQTIKIRFQTIS